MERWTMKTRRPQRNFKFKFRDMGYLQTCIRERGTKEMALEAVVKWCRGHTCTLLLAGLVVLGMILILA